MICRATALWDCRRCLCVLLLNKAEVVAKVATSVLLMNPGRYVCDVSDARFNLNEADELIRLDVDVSARGFATKLLESSLQCKG